jgi:hypothetical protein
MKAVIFLILALTGCGVLPGYEESRQRQRLLEETNIPPEIIKAVIYHESRGDPKAVSHAGAVGLMQVMPRTGKALGYTRRDLFDPHANIQAGTKYLEMMLDQFGDMERALVAYNCGPNKNRAACRGYARRVLSTAEKYRTKRLYERIIRQPKTGGIGWSKIYISAWRQPDYGNFEKKHDKSPAGHRGGRGYLQKERDYGLGKWRGIRHRQRP